MFEYVESYDEYNNLVYEVLENGKYLGLFFNEEDADEYCDWKNGELNAVSD